MHDNYAESCQLRSSALPCTNMPIDRLADIGSGWDVIGRYRHSAAPEIAELWKFLASRMRQRGPPAGASADSIMIDHNVHVLHKS
jgi:hypothetical protein